ncbi:MAG TPA: addiction module protein [Pyrinomonadaceae bacterium]|nr:addiction module protein [Pyrinomonadaceae bacterium]
MSVTEVEELALGLPASERGKLAEKLIRSLPGPFVEDDDDDGVEEALRRSREMDENPEMSLTEEEFFKGFEKYRR